MNPTVSCASCAVWCSARQIFGDPEKALRWLRKAKSGLGGRTPLAALETETGARLVEEWLVRIDQGMAA